MKERKQMDREEALDLLHEAYVVLIGPNGRCLPTLEQDFVNNCVNVCKVFTDVLDCEPVSEVRAIGFQMDEDEEYEDDGDELDEVMIEDGTEG